MKSKVTHLFKVCISLWSLGMLSSLSAQAGFWSGVDRKLATSPGGNVAAVSAHNCYDDRQADPARNLAATLVKIHAAQSAGADLIELDIKSEQGQIRVDHEDDGKQNGARLAELLADPGLRKGDQLLYIEIKEKQPDEIFARALLEQLEQNGFAKPGRPVVLRAFSNIRKNLVLLRDELAGPAQAGLQPNLLLQELFPGEREPDLPAALKRIDRAKASGFHGVEFRHDDRNLIPKLAHARGLGLGTNVYTIPVKLGEVFVAGLREEVDALTVDYPVDRARAVVEENNLLIHQLVNRTFDAKKKQSLTLVDADNAPGEGYLVNVAVQFDTLELRDDQTMAVLNKSDEGGFALELHRAPAAETVLRFGVRVGAQYHYASLPASKLNRGENWFITGAYDGDGGVWLWVNHRHHGVTRGRASGEVLRNDSPVVVGADPQGTDERRFFFSGKVRQVQVLSWGAH